MQLKLTTNSYHVHSNYGYHRFQLHHNHYCTLQQSDNFEFVLACKKLTGAKELSETVFISPSSFDPECTRLSNGILEANLCFTQNARHKWILAVD